mgnify:CR=1 FL=1
MQKQKYKVQLFYNASLRTGLNTVTFSKEESTHIVRVLRKNIGDTILVTNGDGLSFSGKLNIVNPKQCVASIEKETAHKPMPYSLHIAIAPTKRNERFEWFLEKATEIGITEITPLICARSERKIIKAARLKRVLESALKQSLKYYLPKLNTLTTLSDFLKAQKSSESNLYIAHCETSVQKQALPSILNSTKKHTILIGPEGDFTPQEIKAAIAANAQEISLGPSRLRTETAAVLATAMCYHANAHHW